MPFLGDPMKYFLAIIILLFNIAKASASEVIDSSIIEINLSNKTAISLDSFLWEKRLIIVFSNDPQDPSFVTQLNYLRNRLDNLKERDVVIITDTNPNFKSDIRLKLRPRGFAFILIGKDGKIALRKSQPWQVREISRSIDKMPMRKQEIKLTRPKN